MRRTMMVAGLVALLVLTVSGVAFARNFQCTQGNCEGTDRQDTIFERGGDGVSDNIFG